MLQYRDAPYKSGSNVRWLIFMRFSIFKQSARSLFVVGARNRELVRRGSSIIAQIITVDGHGQVRTSNADVRYARGHPKGTQQRWDRLRWSLPEAWVPMPAILCR